MTDTVLRLSHVALLSPDPQRLRAYYEDVIGLTPYDETDSKLFLASGGRGPALELGEGAEPALAHVAFEVREADEDRLLSVLSQNGVNVHVSTDSEPGIQRIHQILDVEGNTIQLCIMDATRDPAPRGTTGVIPDKLGHVASRTRSTEAMTDFYQSALGFRWSDWMGDFFAFLRCNADHHTVNFVNASRPGQLHHFAFELGNGSEILRACDTLNLHGVSLLWGPGRHGIGHNMFIYHPDPDGNVVEFFSDLDRMVSEELGYFEPRAWHEDTPQIPKHWVPDPASANRWGPAAPEGFLA